MADMMMRSGKRRFHRGASLSRPSGSVNEIDRKTVYNEDVFS
jgi:hypothetical protein